MSPGSVNLGEAGEEAEGPLTVAAETYAQELQGVDCKTREGAKDEVNSS